MGTYVRRELVGADVVTRDGQRGRVTGINDQGIARIATGGGRHIDVPQDDIAPAPKG